jgi:hypothetical protein
MIAEKEPTKFTALQLELLKLYAMDLPEQELLEIKDLLGKHFLNRISQHATNAALQQNYTQQDYNNWLNDPKQ